MENEKQFRDPTKMIRLIDANALLEQIEEQSYLVRSMGKVNGKGMFNHTITKTIEDATTVDAVEVVRCRDCRYFSRDKENNRAWCNYFSGSLETAVNGYCYHGAKMDGSKKHEQI